MSYEMIEAERLAFADVLESFGQQDWAQQSLCAGWTVRDVAAHLVNGAKSTPGAFVGGLIASGFSFDKMIAKNLAKESDKDGPTLAKELRSVAALRTKPEKAMLGEIIVHSADIGRALGRQDEHPAANLIQVLENYRKAGAPLRSKQRAAGLRLDANDLEWSGGDGPEVSGPALALLLAIAGRESVLDELSGEGLATLRSRM